MTPEELIKIKELKGTLINSQFWYRKGQTLVKITLDDLGRLYHNWYLLTDDKILVQNDSLSFIDASSEASFTVEYYVLTSENLEIEIASYSFGVIFYNLSDFEIKYNGTSFPDNGVYESGAKITIETSERLKPYLSDLIVAYIPTSAVDVLPYEVYMLLIR